MVPSQVRMGTQKLSDMLLYLVCSADSIFFCDVYGFEADWTRLRLIVNLNPSVSPTESFKPVFVSFWLPVTEGASFQFVAVVEFAALTLFNSHFSFMFCHSPNTINSNRKAQLFMRKRKASSGFIFFSAEIREHPSEVHRPIQQRKQENADQPFHRGQLQFR